MAGLHEQEGVKMAALDLNMEWRWVTGGEAGGEAVGDAVPSPVL